MDFYNNGIMYGLKKKTFNTLVSQLYFLFLQYIKKINN